LRREPLHPRAEFSTRKRSPFLLVEDAIELQVGHLEQDGQLTGQR
jgi:hypothetical protein